MTQATERVPLGLELPDLTDGFGDSCGTSRYHQHPDGVLIYTDGIADMCRKLQCNWLLNRLHKILSDDYSKEFPIHYWTLVAKDKKATMYMQINDEDPKIIEDIGTVDLPDGKIQFRGNWDELYGNKVFIAGLYIEG